MISVYSVSTFCLLTAAIYLVSGITPEGTLTVLSLALALVLN